MNMIVELNQVLEKAVMSDMLRKAVEDIIEALKKEDVETVFQLSACKSYITSDMDPNPSDYTPPDGHGFREDDDHNIEVLGESVYGKLGSLNCTCALKLRDVPAGMTVFSARGSKEMTKKDIDHPVIQRMKLEQECIVKGIQKGIQKREAERAEIKA